jgi:hypothetical protein
MERFTSIEKGDEDILICVAHVLASHKGGTMFEGEDIIKYADLVDTAPDVYLFGHWHKDQGVEEIGGKQFVNIGSLTRGSLSQDNMDRIPSAAVLRCTEKGVEIEVVPLNGRPAEEVFDVEGRQRQVKRQVEMDSFVTAIRDALQPAKEGETLAEAVTGMGDVPNEIREDPTSARGSTIRRRCFRGTHTCGYGAPEGAPDEQIQYTLLVTFEDVRGVPSTVPLEERLGSD